MNFQNILLPVSGADADEEAIKLACRLAKPDKAKLCAVYIIPIGRTLPLDAELETEVERAEEILDRTESIAREQGCSLDTDLLQARDIGPTIINEAVERGSDLIVMGAEYKQRFGQFSMGEVVPYVLKNTPCRVILFHQYIDQTKES